MNFERELDWTIEYVEDLYTVSPVVAKTTFHFDHTNM